MLSREMFGRLALDRKAALIAFDAFAAICAACALLPAFTQLAYAYVDPSVMTCTIQTLAGVAVALSTVLGVAIRDSTYVKFAPSELAISGSRFLWPCIGCSTMAGQL